MSGKRTKAIRRAFLNGANPILLHKWVANQFRRMKKEWTRSDAR